jgi:hypothetical protein
MNLMGLKSARNDRVAEVLLGILGTWADTHPSTWMRHIETAYERTNRTGTIIGLFSNLAGKLGKPIQEQPFFQIEAVKLPSKKGNLKGPYSNHYGLDKYLGEEIHAVMPMLIPFLVYCGSLKQSPGNQFWRIDIGDWRKSEPLVVSFACGKTLLRLTVFGHVLINDAKLINESTVPPMVVSTPEEGLFSWSNLIEEQVVVKLANNKEGFPVYHHGAGDTSTPVGTYSNPRIENGSIAVDIRFIRPFDYPHGAVLHVMSDLEKDPKRSQTKYRKGYITQHVEFSVCVTGAPPQ